MKVWKPILAAFLLAVPGARAAADGGMEFGDQLDNDGKFWQQSADEFLAGGNARFFKRNTDGANGDVHYAADRGAPLLKFQGIRVWEATVRFAGDKVSTASLSLFNRGDSGMVADKSQFDAMVAKSDEAVTMWVGASGSDLPVQKLANGIEVRTRRWSMPPYRLALQWSSATDAGRRFRAEYIQLDITKEDGKRSSSATLKTGSTVKTSDLKKNLKKEEDGTVWIFNMPMVDQGAKGYCAVATAERVMRYYGSEVSEHLLAGLANSSAKGGTNPYAMLEALKQSGPKLGLSVRQIEDFDMRIMNRMLEAYNRQAKKEKKEQAPMGVQNIGMLYSMLDPKILMDVRCKGSLAPEFQKFQREIAQKIDAGVPLLWGVQLGLYPEVPALPQAKGGHMRLIIGYNAKKKEIVYTDSWGDGHERKTMSMEQAWAMTTFLAALEAWKN